MKIKFLYLINRLTRWHKCQIGGDLHRIRMFFYDKITKCPHCGFEMTSWAMCPRCGYVFCIKCMTYKIGGFGGCPKCT